MQFQPELNEGEDLTPWGYAPGGYLFRCIDCPPNSDACSLDYPIGAKRSWRCVDHAREKRESAPAAGAPKTTVDGSYEWPITPRNQA